MADVETWQIERELAKAVEQERLANGGVGNARKPLELAREDLNDWKTVASSGSLSKAREAEAARRRAADLNRWKPIQKSHRIAYDIHSETDEETCGTGKTQLGDHRTPKTAPIRSSRMPMAAAFPSDCDPQPPAQTRCSVLACGCLQIPSRTYPFPSSGIRSLRPALQ